MKHFKKHLSPSRTYFVIIGLLIIIGVGSIVASLNSYSEGMDEPEQEEKEDYKEGLWEGPSKNWSGCEVGLLVVLVYLAANFVLVAYMRAIRGKQLIYAKI